MPFLPLILLKENPSHLLLLGPPSPPPRLSIFGFSKLALKRFEQYKMYLSIRYLIKSNEIDFFECFRFQYYF